MQNQLSRCTFSQFLGMAEEVVLIVQRDRCKVTFVPSGYAAKAGTDKDEIDVVPIACDEHGIEKRIADVISFLPEFMEDRRFSL